jgi:hypothetical protein
MKEEYQIGPCDELVLFIAFLKLNHLKLLGVLHDKP